ncbi:MAG: baseplate J/gp47 family protein [Muribaculaceae bacterium]|nr:baseplate J/gp47 family protein [Muribaculaceae bacterium]MCM1439327.1 baseplate J/gp47 family protein [Roseburia sp.]
MSNISQLANVPEISFIENMTLEETEGLMREHYFRIYKELTGTEPTLGEADALNLVIKSFSLILYQVMQYVDAKGRAELLKTSTGEALDAIAALLGISRQGARRATAVERFTLSGVRGEATAIPAGTRVKTQGGKYFNTLDYAEIPAGDMSVDVAIQAEEAGAESNAIPAGDIDILVDPIPYVAAVVNTEDSTGGLDVEDDDGLTERVWLAPSKYSCAGPRDAYEYYVREWRSDVEDVQIVSPTPCVVNIYVTLGGGRLPTETERASLEAYLSADTMRPLGELVEVKAPEEVEYGIELTYWIGSSDQKAAGTIQAQVEAAIDEYEGWQRKLGRDINPTELIARIRGAGAKRVKLTNPADIVVGKTELPKRGERTVAYGGLEDD